MWDLGLRLEPLGQFCGPKGSQGGPGEGLLEPSGKADISEDVAFLESGQKGALQESPTSSRRRFPNTFRNMVSLELPGCSLVSWRQGLFIDRARSPPLWACTITSHIRAPRSVLGLSRHHPTWPTPTGPRTLPFCLSSTKPTDSSQFCFRMHTHTHTRTEVESPKTTSLFLQV